SAESEWFTRGHLRTHHRRWPLHYRHAPSGTRVSQYSEFLVSGCVERRRSMDEDVSQRATLGGLRSNLGLSTSDPELSQQGLLSSRYDEQGLASKWFCQQAFESCVSRVGMILGRT